MSRIPALSQKKRKLEEGMQGRTSRPKKRVRKQRDYHSSSDDESDSPGSDAGFVPANLQDPDEEKTEVTQPEKQKQHAKSKPKRKDPKSLADDSSEASHSNSSLSGSDSDSPSHPQRKQTKRNDPVAFSTSITRILSTKLPSSTRTDPLLSRSSTFRVTTTALKNEQLSARAAAHVRARRREEKDKFRDKDVTGTTEGRAGVVAEEEKRLRKIAQRGVVKLFNAVRVAQGRGEGGSANGMGGGDGEGVVVRKEREERGQEMSKKGFLELIGVTAVKGLGEGDGD